MDNKKLAERNDANNTARPPDYSSRQYGIAVWVNKDKNQKDYLSLQIPLLGVKVNCFQTHVQGEEEE